MKAALSRRVGAALATLALAACGVAVGTTSASAEIILDPVFTLVSNLEVDASVPLEATVTFDYTPTAFSTGDELIRVTASPVSGNGLGFTSEFVAVPAGSYDSGPRALAPGDYTVVVEVQADSCDDGCIGFINARTATFTVQPAGPAPVLAPPVFSGSVSCEAPKASVISVTNPSSSTVRMYQEWEVSDASGAVLYGSGTPLEPGETTTSGTTDEAYLIEDATYTLTVRYTASPDEPWIEAGSTTFTVDCAPQPSPAPTQGGAQLAATGSESDFAPLGIAAGAVMVAIGAVLLTRKRRYTS